MAILKMSNNDNIGEMADRVVTLLRNVRIKTLQADVSKTNTIINLHHVLVAGLAGIQAIQTQYGAAKIGTVIAGRFDFDWQTEASNFAALINTVMPDAVAYIESIQGTILVGSFAGDNVAFPAPTIEQQAQLQTHITSLSSYLV